MNILQPAELEPVELGQLTECLERHGVTKFESTKYGVETLLMLKDGNWQTTKNGTTLILVKTKKSWRIKEAE